MIQPIRFVQTGGPELLFEAQVEDIGETGTGQVLIQQYCIGMNFIETYYITAGIVLASGTGVTRFCPGDRVCYAGGSSTLGAYYSAHICVQLLRLVVMNKTK